MITNSMSETCGKLIKLLLFSGGMSLVFFKVSYFKWSEAQNPLSL